MLWPSARIRHASQSHPVPAALQRRLTKMFRGKELAAIEREYREIQKFEKLRRKRDQDGRGKAKGSLAQRTFSYGPGATLAYTACRMLPSFSLVQRVLKDVQETHLPEFTPSTVLDFGAGPGTVAWAAQDVWPESLERVSMVEPSRSMWEVAELLLDPDEDFDEDFGQTDESAKADAASSSVPEAIQALKDLGLELDLDLDLDANDVAGTHCDEAPPASVAIDDDENDKDVDAPKPLVLDWYRGLPTLHDHHVRLARKAAGHVLEDEGNEADGLLSSFERYDLVTAAYALSELPSDDARLIALKLLWKHLNPGGVLLVLEHGDLWGSRVVQLARSSLVPAPPPQHAQTKYQRDPLHRAQLSILMLCTYFLKTRRILDEAGPAMMDASTGVGNGTDSTLAPRVLAPCSHSGVCPMLALQRDFTMRKALRKQRKRMRLEHDIGVREGELPDPGLQIESQRDAMIDRGRLGGTGQTPSLSRAWCHFTHRVPRFVTVSESTKSGMGSDGHSQTFSYVAIQKGSSGSAAPELSPMGSGGALARIIRHPGKKGAKRVTLDLCAADERLVRTIVSKRRSKRITGDGGCYRSARKASWGGTWPMAWLEAITPEPKQHASPQSVGTSGAHQATGDSSPSLLLFDEEGMDEDDGWGAIDRIVSESGGVIGGADRTETES